MAVKKEFGTSFHVDQIFRENPVRFERFDLFQIGEICCEREYEISLHVQHCDEISLILSGKGVFYIDEQVFPVRQGDVILNKTGQRHRICSDREEKLRFAYLGYRFHRNEIGEEWRAVRDYLDAAKQQVVWDHEGMALYFPRALRECYSTVPQKHLLFEILVQELLLLTYRDFVRGQAQIPLLDARDSATEETIYRIMFKQCIIHFADSVFKVYNLTIIRVVSFFKF